MGELTIGASAETKMLSTVLAGLAEVKQADDRPVSGLSADSRTLVRGDLFIATPGASADGRRFIAEAVRRGACAVAHEARDWPAVAGTPVPAYPVVELAMRTGLVADRFFDSPSRRIKIVAVTGTNGKTTVSHLTAQALTALGRRCGLIGTLGCGFPDRLGDISLTTPDAIRLQQRLAGFVEQGAACACIEASSHALAQGRADGVAVDTAVFTNLSHDHLDYHGSMAEYGRAKARLFGFPGLRHAVVNVDDPLGATLRKQTSAETVWSYGGGDADVRARDVSMGMNGMRLHVATPLGPVDVETALFGRFNVSNVLAVITTLIAHGVGREDIAAVMRDLVPVPGRMELFRGAADRPTVAVDYAHTPDALAEALRALREHTAGKLWCVFGCGGDRDREKRPIMGQIADRLADNIVITDDNPRREAPVAIVDDIRAGMGRDVPVIHDRSRAIQWAIEQATAGDLVLVAGKGHESTQDIDGQVVPMDDRQIVVGFMRKVS